MSTTTATAGDMLNALNRAIARLQAEADRLNDAGDYNAEFPAGDADALREVVKLLGVGRADRVQFQRAPDPMEAPLPCSVKVGHVTLGRGVPLRCLVDHAKRLYRLAHGQDADVVASEPLQSRIARGDAFLARLRAPLQVQAAGGERLPCGRETMCAGVCKCIPF